MVFSDPWSNLWIMEDIEVGQAFLGSYFYKYIPKCIMMGQATNEAYKAATPPYPEDPPEN